MRRRRRHGRGYYNDNYSSDSGILLTEFRFYNKRKNVIEDSILLDIQSKLLNGKKDVIFWTNKDFADSGVGFKFYRETINSDDNKNTKDIYNVFIEMIDFQNKIIIDDYIKNKAIYFNRLFIHYDITEEEKNVLDRIDSDLRKLFEKLECKKITAWKEIVEYLITNNIFNIGSKNIVLSDWDEYKTTFKLLFGEELDERIYYKAIGKDRWGHEDAYHIIKVVEKRYNNKNYRMVAICNVYNDTYFIDMIPEDNIYYNQYDVSRLYIRKHIRSEIENDYRLLFIPAEFNEYTIVKDEFYSDKEGKRIEVDRNKLIINRDIIHAIKKNILEIVDSKEQLIRPIIYNFYKERVTTFGDYDSSKLTYEEQKIINKYLEILDKGKEIKINQVSITKKSIMIDNMFVIEFDENFLKMTDILVKLRTTLKDNNVRYNFNSLYEHIIDLSAIHTYKYNEDYTYFKSLSFKVNNVNIHMERDGRRMKINGIFCRVSDIFYILSKAVCYGNTEEYNKYIKDISYIGVEWKRMINNGVVIELSNSMTSSFKKVGMDCDYKLNLRFSFLWDANKRSDVYLLLNGVKHLIKYKGKFKQNFGSINNYLSISDIKLKLNESIEYLNDDNLLEIIEASIKEAEIVKKRGEELVEETIQDVNAVEETIIIDRVDVKGYTVIGAKTKTKYFIKKGGNLDVYKYENGSWNRRCVVDDHSKNRIYEDKLANRLVNIFNEPEKIFTLFNT